MKNEYLKDMGWKTEISWKSKDIYWKYLCFLFHPVGSFRNWAYIEEKKEKISVLDSM